MECEGKKRRAKKAQGGKRDKEREKLMNRQDTERKSLLHFLSSLSGKKGGAKTVILLKI